MAAASWYLIVCSVLMVGQYYLERHFGRGFGTNEAEDQAVRAPGRGWRSLMPDGNDTDASNLPLVHAVNVMKAFHGTEVLKGIDLDVDTGEVVCLLGPSGSGKTTFLRCINQLETIDGGRIWVDGDLMGYEDRGGKLHHLTDKQIAAPAPRHRHGLPAVQPLPAHDGAARTSWRRRCQVKGEKKDEARERALALLERVGLQGQARRLPGAALRRPAAAGRHRPGAGDGAQADAVRRADLGARPRARRRGARRSCASSPRTA